MIKNLVLCIIKDDENRKILLGLKKRGFGIGKWNGFGGKIENEETTLKAAIRELKEETGLIAQKLKDIGKLVFIFPLEKEILNVIIYLIEKYDGEPIESDEIDPAWFDYYNIPYDDMWEDDRHWLPAVLKNGIINGTFYYENDKIKKFILKVDFS